MPKSTASFTTVVQGLIDSLKKSW